ncbi:hypothetical protein MADA3029_280001 [Vibrio nigripulchritudo MADA3029]|nr:hypothetical protein VIBNIMADA3020_100001 [Vibrio nigripulchritudo MADA3020]CCN51491.1 hypothetical protein VIBNIMADA3021_1090001 [Vibrio nigripulchritudo MADA3021]CCN58871.1 hypothetical protein MADA3029_280001 [Vibrio nigripulchritudo MADA3029]
MLEEIVPHPEYQAIYQKKYQEFKTLYSEYEKSRSNRVGTGMGRH